LSKKFKKLLVANRGEIAVRIIRAARKLGIRSVAAYSDADSGTIPTRLADEAINIGKSRAQESYLNPEKLINAAIQTGCTAIHPGYGFLSENHQFNQSVRDAGLIYVGPDSEAVRIMGDKDLARKKVSEHGVPVLEGAELEEGLDSISKRIGFPMLVKAVSGGSGRGMRRVDARGELEDAIGEAQRESLAAFGDDRVIIEKYLENPRHIEVQIFGDGKGNVVHFGERECSIQRRHQKLIEEAPAPGLSEQTRKRLFDAAILAGKCVNYAGAGTVEFLVEGGSEKNSAIWFLEMNTRIQVEHPVTEEVWGVDLVKMQLELAWDELGKLGQLEKKTNRHSIEFRVYAEDPENSFIAKSGEILLGYGVREDGWIESGTVLTGFYDTMLTKLIVSGSSREDAIDTSKSILSETVVEGFPTTLGFHRWLLEQDDFTEGNVHIHWLGKNYNGEIIPCLFTGPIDVPETKKV